MTNSSGQRVGASCGSTASVNNGDSCQIGTSLSCDGVQVSFSRSWTWSITHTITSGPCQRCYGMVCFPEAVLTVTTCKYTYPEWDCPEPVCRTQRPCRFLGMITRYVHTVDFNPGGSVEYSQSCSDASCDCRALGNNCPCPTPPPPPAGESVPPTGTIVPITEPTLIGVNASEFDDEVRLHGAAASLDDLALFQLVMLQDVIKKRASEFSDPTLFAVAFEGGGVLQDESFALLETLKNRFDTLLKSDSRLDFDRDGDVDAQDRGLFDVCWTIREQGGPWPIQLDSDGDGSLTERDRCAIYSATE